MGVIKTMEMRMLLILLAMLMMPSAYAQVYGDMNIITDHGLIDSVENFQDSTNAVLALSVLNRTDDITAEAEHYYNMSDADIIIVYDMGGNKIAVAKPKGRDVLSDEKISAILDERQDEKLLIVDNKDVTAYLAHIVSDIALELSSAIETYSVCSVIKDGYCNESCYQDLDCDCGNNLCDYHENYLTCPNDCEKSMDYGCVMIADNYCDKNCPIEDVDCRIGSFTENVFDVAKRKRTMMIALQVVIGATLIMLIVVFIYLMEKGLFRKVK